MTVAGFVLNARPVPASRPRVFRNGGVAYPKAHREYETWLKKELLKCPSLPTSGLVDASFEFIMPPYKGSDYPTHRTDLDNLAKLPLDMMTQSRDAENKPRYWEDDSLIVTLRLSKRFAEEGEDPHTKVYIRSI